METHMKIPSFSRVLPPSLRLKVQATWAKLNHNGYQANLSSNPTGVHDQSHTIPGMKTRRHVNVEPNQSFCFIWLNKQIPSYMTVEYMPFVMAYDMIMAQRLAAYKILLF